MLQLFEHRSRWSAVDELLGAFMAVRSTIPFQIEPN